MMTMEEWRKAYLDGMTAQEWVAWADKLNWLLTPTSDQEKEPS